MALGILISIQNYFNQRITKKLLKVSDHYYPTLQILIQLTVKFSESVDALDPVYIESSRNTAKKLN